MDIRAHKVTRVANFGTKFIATILLGRRAKQEKGPVSNDGRERRHMVAAKKSLALCRR
jgi:hypothetical protein